MPGRDGTGPLGAGPMTGRAMGNCAVTAGLGYANAAPEPGFSGRGRGFGGAGRGGGGRGWRHWYRATGIPGWMRFGWRGVPFATASGTDAEKQMLSEQAQALQAQLDAIKTRLDSMESQDPAK